MRWVPAQRGVTLVELLVTIVLAGIAFAALVPVFVLASRQSSIDRTRTVAMNIAQSRAEAIRSLPYDLVTTGIPPAEGMNLVDRERDISPTRDMRFDGPWKNDSSAKVYRIDYSVTDAPNGQDFKFVTITVTWDGAPTAGKPIVLRTAVYRRPYRLDAVGLKVFSDLTPLPQDVSGVLVFDTTPLKGRVTVDPLTAANVRHVIFSVAANNGADPIAEGTVSNYGESDLNYPRLRYDWTWEGSGNSPDGDYTFSAVAVARDGTTQMWQRPVRLDCDKNPEAPEWVTGMLRAGQSAVMVTWSPTPAGDLLNYAVERRRADDMDGSSSVLFEDLPPWSTTLVDRRLLTSGTQYKYRVMAYDEYGNPSDWSQWTTDVTGAPVLTPSGADTVSPGAVGSVGAQQASAIIEGVWTWVKRIDVSWAASADPDVAYYFVYRSRLDGDGSFADAGVGWGSPLSVVEAPSQSTFDASVDWRGLYQYSVSTVDSALNESNRVLSPSVSVQLTSGEYYLTVRPRAIAGIDTRQWYALFSFVSLDTGEVYPKPWGISQPNPKTWVGTRSYTETLDVFGRYRVTAYYYSSQAFVGSMSQVVDLANQRDVTFVWTGGP